ncbi:uncharacterized protein V1516DRAFT_666001 [Lipomyces oligophaga]|uniref:uncharacterized protein n=1 Tax=Lipomyces oligophaga TaxID=45792 RepID=UPI0034CE0B91
MSYDLLSMPRLRDYYNSVNPQSEQTENTDPKSSEVTTEIPSVDQNSAVSNTAPHRSSSTASRRSTSTLVTTDLPAKTQSSYGNHDGNESGSARPNSSFFYQAAGTPVDQLSTPPSNFHAPLISFEDVFSRHSSGGQLNQRSCKQALLDLYGVRFGIVVLRFLFKYGENVESKFRTYADLFERSFDSDNSEAISRDEFRSMYSYIESWRANFQQCDRDRSGSISTAELHSYLISTRYVLSYPAIEAIMRSEFVNSNGELSFDTFIIVCIVIERIRERFKMHADENYTATFNFEQFMVVIFELLL